MKKHFPSHTEKQTPEYTQKKIPTKKISIHNYKPRITPDSLRRVLLGFRAKKSPGLDKFKHILFNYLLRNITELISFI